MGWHREAEERRASSWLFTRRGTLSLAILAFAHVRVMAQAWSPNKPVRLLVGFAAGGFTDSISRAFATELKGSLGQEVVVENRPGPAGAVALQAFIKEPADGLTLLIAGVEILSSGPALESLKPVAPIGTIPHVAITSANRDVSDLRRQPGLKIYAPGYFPRIFLSKLGYEKPQVVEFRAFSEGLAAVLGGNVDVAILPFGQVSNYVASGRVKTVAAVGHQGFSELRGAARLAELPEETTPFVGLFASSSTPVNIIATLNAAANKALDSQQLKQRFQDLGIVPRKGSSQDLEQMILVQKGVVPDKCKRKDNCEADTTCPRPCPTS